MERGVKSDMGKTPPLPVIAVTSGEPAGIGPDICLALAALHPPCRAVILADQELLAARAARLGLALRLRPYDPALVPAPGELDIPISHGREDSEATNAMRRASY